MERRIDWLASSAWAKPMVVAEQKAWPNLSRCVQDCQGEQGTRQQPKIEKMRETWNWKVERISSLKSRFFSLHFSFRLTSVARKLAFIRWQQPTVFRFHFRFRFQLSWLILPLKIATLYAMSSRIEELQTRRPTKCWWDSLAQWATVRLDSSQAYMLCKHLMM